MSLTHLLLNNTKDEINNAIYSFFHPLKHVRSIINSNFISKKDYDGKFYKKILSTVSQSICYNQGELIQYSFIAAEKHKELKNAFNKGKRSNDEIKYLLEDLIVFLNNKFFEITATNFEYLHLIFSERNSVPPRICLKGNFRTEDKNTVVSVFRDTYVPYASDCEIEHNTGFFQILTNGKFYLNNDLPNSATKGHYSNPRLSQGKLIEYKSSKIKYISSLLNMLDISEVNPISWKDCWKDSSSNDDFRSFYKSTLIIPMTFWNNKLMDEFKLKVNIKNVDRVIFGFLCFDHVDKNYFDRDIDIEIGYIFADILSIFLFNRLVYTEISETFNNIEYSLDDDVVSRIMERIDFSLNDLHNKSFMYTDFVQNIKETKNNQLFSIDSILKLYGSSLSSDKSKIHTEQSH